MINLNEEFIIKANNIHNNKYDYSKSMYLGYHSKVEIICPIHGSYFKIAHLHLKGSGCNKCNKYASLMTTEDFIKKAKNIHGNKYNYSKSIYKGANKKVTIICPIHGEFLQDGFRHLIGNGCKKCFIDKNKLSTQDFIIRAQRIHKNKYDYSISKYKTGKHKIKIICPNHGAFLQLAESHLQGIGCPKCGYAQIIKSSKPEIKWLSQFFITEYQKYIKYNNKSFIVDGYDELSNTVYEFYGDFWHGNPKKFNEDDINPKSKTTYGELYSQTLEREKILTQLGYNVVSIWESDWSNQNVNKCK